MIPSIRVLLGALALGCLLVATPADLAVAQGCGAGDPNCVAPTPPLGDNSNRIATTSFIQATIGGGLPLNQGFVFLGNGSNFAQGTPTPIFGVAGSVAGTIGLSGVAAGVVTIKTSDTTGTYPFWLPIAAGTAGAPLLSGGGTGPQTYGAVSAIWLNLDVNFASVGGNLAFANIASGSLLANCGALGAEPTGCTLTSYLDRAIGSTNGMFVARTGGAWASATFGTGLAFAGSVLNLQPASVGAIGGVNSIAAVSHQWINSISTLGVPSLSQPAFGDLSGSVVCAQLPALTGNVTTPAGSCVSTIAAAAVQYAMIQNVAASRLLGNPTGSPASPSEISLGATLAFSGTALQTGAGSGDVAWSANSFSTTIQAAAVSFAKFQNIAALSVFGNCTNAATTGGNVTGTTNQVLRVNGAGNSCGFGSIDLSQAATVGASIIGQANGGTGQATAVAARQASGLNIWGDQGTGHGDTPVTIGNTERFAYTTAAFTASRAWVLPAANVTGQPYAVMVADMAGGVSGTNTLVITRAGADTINGGTTSTIAASNGGNLCVSDGVSKWTCQSWAAGSGITSITAGTGLSGGTITTSGTIAVSLSTLSNALGADVAMNNTANYFPGPTVAQGLLGVWYASGTATMTDTAGAAALLCKLWDGTTIIASSAINSSGANLLVSMSLSGTISAPTGNIRMDCRDLTSTSGLIKFNASGNSKDSAITVHRIQ